MKKNATKARIWPASQLNQRYPLDWACKSLRIIRSRGASAKRMVPADQTPMCQISFEFANNPAGQLALFSTAGTLKNEVIPINSTARIPSRNSQRINK